MTLADARDYLAPYIENGTCSDRTLVRTVINEAQRRLYDTGDYINVIRRWGVTVDENGEFDLPSRCEVAMRVSELADGISHTPTGLTHCRDAYAFVFDSTSLLRFTMIRPGRFRILGPFPAAVDVMGRVEYTNVVDETDSLIIDDPDALKLMVLGIWRENNNAPELAADLIGKAVERLTTKTKRSVEAAKLALYQNQLATANPGTRGYARVKASLSLNDGERMIDGRVATIVDDAERRIMAAVSMTASYLCKAIGGYFSCPREIEAILRVDINNAPTHLNGQTYEFLQYGPGYKEGPYDSDQVVYRGEYALQADMPYQSAIEITAGGTNRGISVTLEGIRDGVRITETKTLNGGEAVTTDNAFDDVFSITAPPRDGELSFVVGDTEVALMQPYETDSRRARYGIPHIAGDSDPKILRILGRPRWLPKLRDEQRMQIENEQAITSMVIAIELERAGKFQEAAGMAAQAIKMVNDEMMLRNSGHAVKVDRVASGLHLKKANRGR